MDHIFYPECYYPQNVTGKHQLFTVSPNCEKTDEKLTRGSAASYFFEELKKYPQIYDEFDILSNVRVVTEFGKYYPDIVLVTKKGSFDFVPGNYFDIEIDEPFDESGTPMHFVEECTGKFVSIDKEQNDYLTKNGWTVIRFAEEQVLKNTFECVKIIAKTLVLLEHGQRVFAQSYVKSFPVKKWTKEEAEQLFATKR